MNNEKCSKIIANNIPDYVITIFWFSITVIMLAIIIGIIIFGLRILGECYQERREAYLLNKKYKLQIELLEKQKNERLC